jgi:hypothetical protein
MTPQFAFQELTCYYELRLRGPKVAIILWRESAGLVRICEGAWWKKNINTGLLPELHLMRNSVSGIGLLKT